MTLEILSILGNVPLDIEILNRYSRIGDITYKYIYIYIYSLDIVTFKRKCR